MTTTKTSVLEIPIPPLGTTGTADGYGALMQAAEDKVLAALAAKAAIINPMPGTSPGYSGDTVVATNGSATVTLAFEDVCCVDDNGDMQPVDASSAATGRGLWCCVGTVAGGPEGTVAPGEDGLFINYGFLRNDSHTFASLGGNATIWPTAAGTSGNTWSQDTPTAGLFVNNLGYPIADHVWNFRPSPDLIEVGI